MLLSTKEISKRTLAVSALILAAVFWGIGPVVTKHGLQDVPPFSLAFLRNVLAFIILLPVALAKGFFKVKRADLFPMLLVGLFGSGLNGIFFFAGLSRTSATASIAIFATVPLINAIAASLILKEKPTLVRILGVMIAFLGSFLIALGPAFLGKNITGDVLGNFLVVGSVFCWVAYIIGSKKLLDKYSPITIIVFSYIAGIAVLFPLFFSEFLNNPHWFLNVGFNGLTAIIYGGIISGVVAFTLFQWGMQYTSAFEAGIVVYLQPVLTDIFAVPVLGEKLSPVFLLGSALILGGVFLATTYELIQKRRE